MIETSIVHLPHGVDLSVRTCGKPGSSVLMFLHGFPEAAFVWDEYLEHFAGQGYRAVAPNLGALSDLAVQPRHLPTALNI